MKTFNKTICGSLFALLASTNAFANDNSAENAVAKNEEVNELQDMSDPLAVFSMVGIGVTDRGFNIKYGSSYDSGSDNTQAMNIFELKGFGGQETGFSQTADPDNSIDSFRIRNFEVDVTTGRGTQIDFSYDVVRENLNTSYSFIQALPKMGRLQLYPLAGVGLSIQNNAIDRMDGGVAVIDNGYSTEGSYGIIGVYSKIDITDKIWINYNPMFMTTLSGSDYYKDNAYGAGNSDLLLHEVAISYQTSDRTNVKYFANFSDEVDFKDGEHRIEFNYQF